MSRFPMSRSLPRFLPLLLISMIFAMGFVSATPRATGRAEIMHIDSRTSSIFSVQPAVAILLLTVSTLSML
jgi:hypothetical protein